MLENQVTVEDPEFLAGPWTWTWMYKRWPGYKIEEYVCEDNRDYVDEHGNVWATGPGGVHVFAPGGAGVARPAVLPDEYRALTRHGFDLAAYLAAAANEPTESAREVPGVKKETR